MSGSAHVGDLIPIVCLTETCWFDFEMKVLSF